MLTESREEFSDLHSIFRLRALRYSFGHAHVHFYGEVELMLVVNIRTGVDIK